MTIPIEHLTRWVVGSVLKHIVTKWQEKAPSIPIQTIFEDRKSTAPQPVPGSNVRTEAQEREYVELRTDGPYYTRVGPTEIGRIQVFANLYIPVLRGMAENIYRPLTLAGYAAYALDGPISIYKLGPDPAIDTGDLVDCLTTYIDIARNEHGKRDNTVDIFAQSIETGYHCHNIRR